MDDDGSGAYHKNVSIVKSQHFVLIFIFRWHYANDAKMFAPRALFVSKVEHSIEPNRFFCIETIA